LLANNEPGQQDPRMAQSSGILLGAKRDVQLDGGTKMVIGVAASAGTSPGGN
jgi:NaMN:DMB phosphoribosyltransferase